MGNKNIILKKFLLWISVGIWSIAMSNIVILDNHFVFIIPWIFFCFMNNMVYGGISLAVAMGNSLFVNKWLVLLFPIVIFGLCLFKNNSKRNKQKLPLTMGGYAFSIVFACGCGELFINNNFNVFPFVDGVISYWLMLYFCKLYYALKGIDGEKLDSSISSFLFVLIGIVLVSLNINIYSIDVSLIGLIFLAFLSVQVGLEVGAVYTMVMLISLVFKGESVIHLIIFGYTFLIVHFMGKSNKLTMACTYLGSVLFVIYYWGLDYSLLFNYGVASFMFLLIPTVLIEKLCRYCYGNKRYLKEFITRSEKSNRIIASKIVEMGEVFSLVCEKIDVKERLKKNDRRLFAQEVNVFNNILEKFSADIKEVGAFDLEKKVEKEFYKYNADLLNLNISENALGDIVIAMDIRCAKKEINEFVLPLVNRTLKRQFKISFGKYNDMFGYYSLILKNAKKVRFKYGISQRSLDGKYCGDSYLIYENERYHIFSISDGMGTGEKAKESSKLALNLLKKFINIGFDINQALNSLNGVLKEKYNRERYSTLDILVYDKYEDKFFVCKNGASDSYLIRKGKQSIRGNRLPIGIVEKFECELKEIEVEKGDLFVIVSDGVEETCLGDVEKFKNCSVQKISEKIIGKERDIKDDKTVLAIKIDFC